MEKPPPFFKDITSETKERNTAIESWMLPELAKACNNMMIPSILCPWGDSVFAHRCGSISIDLIFQRYLQKHEITMINSDNLSKVKWTRDDFIRDDNDYDMFLLNPEWKILPTIAFIDGVPKVLTSKIHHNGSTYMMIHPSRWHHNLPAIQPDQIAHVVVT